MSIVHFNVIAFWFKAPGDEIYAPKLGMDVTIVDSGFTKHDSNPAFVSERSLSMVCEHNLEEMSMGDLRTNNTGSNSDVGEA